MQGGGLIACNTRVSRIVRRRKNDGSGNKATEGEINDFRNSFTCDEEITEEFLGTAIGYGKLCLLMQQLDAQIKRGGKDMIEDGRESAEESEEDMDEEEGEEEEVDGKVELPKRETEGT